MRLRRIQLIGAAVCAPLALGACGLTRPPAQATAPIPAQFYAPLPPGARSPALPHGGSLPALADWWREADDPLLVDLIEAAEAASPTVASAAARLAEARSAQVAAGAALVPRLDASLVASRGNTLTAGAPTPGGAAPPVTTLLAGAQASWELDLFSGLRAGREAAALRRSGADAQWHDARVSVAAQTATLYVDERACQRQLAVATVDTRSRAETARLTGLAAQAGFQAPANAALARASTADASARLTQQRAQCAVLRTSLVALSGLDAQVLEQKIILAPLERSLPAIKTIASVPAEALAQRPDVYAAELGVAAASADAGAAEAQRYPRLTLQGSIAALQFRSGGISQSLDSWSIGPVTLSVPLFDGGARAANAEAAGARYGEAVSLYRASVRQAVREVEEALVNLQATDARGGDAEAAVRDYQASFDAAQARYDSGLASLFELEDARRTLFAAQTARVSLQRERAQAWVALYRALGGGWSRPEVASAATAGAATTAATAAAGLQAAPSLSIPSTPRSKLSPRPRDSAPAHSAPTSNLRPA